jgi:hypothetical protein
MEGIMLLATSLVEIPLEVVMQIHVLDVGRYELSACEPIGWIAVLMSICGDKPCLFWYTFTYADAPAVSPFLLDEFGRMFFCTPSRVRHTFVPQIIVT